jgi:preprotein translocase SecF subunit
VLESVPHTDVKATESVEHVKDGLRVALGDLLMPEGIADMKVDSAPGSTQSKVSFRVQYTGDVPKATVEKNAQGFLFDVAVDGPDAGRAFGVSGTYNVAATPEIVRALATTNMKRDLPRVAEAGGVSRGIELSEPFLESDLIGPRVGSELRDKAVIALFLAFVVQVIFVRIRFKGYRWGLAAMLADAHDVFTTLAALSISRWLGIVHVEFDLTTVAVLLTIVGYSINDTIVIFDRIRENLPRMNKSLTEVVDISVNQTLSRTLLTSLTVFLTSAVIFVLNYGKGNVLEGFSFGMMFGVLTGTFSSVYIASPIVIWLVKRSAKRGRVPADVALAASP